MFPDAAAWIIPINRIAKHHERHQRITLVIWPFRVISIGRKQQLGLAQEPALAVFIEAEQRNIDQMPIIQQIAGHAHPGGGPGRMIVNALERFRRSDRQKICRLAKHLIVDSVALLGRQRIADRLIPLYRIDQPHGVIQNLPEQSPRILVRLCRMFAQSRIKLCIAKQHIAGITCIFRLARQAV